MRPRLISWILVALLAAAAGWFARSVRHEHPAAGSRAGERRILYYQSAMHPWIRSDQPGKCTICGMDLSPVYEGESGIAAGADVINLSSNNVTVANVATSPATRKPLIRTVRVAGTIEDDASRRRVLSAYTDGRLDRLFVTYPGAEVKAGQPLAWLFSPTLLAAVREYVGLVRTGSAASPDSTSMVAAAASRLVQLGLTPEQVTKLPETFSPTNLHVEILAPLTGTVVVKDVLEGQTVAAGQRLFELADFSTMWFQFEAYEQDLAWLHPGQPVEVRSPAWPGVTLTNAISFIDPNFNAVTRTTKVRVELPNPTVEFPGAHVQRLLRNRVYADGWVEVKTPDVLTVPRSAVLDSGQPFVFVELSDGKYQPRPVSLGRRGDSDVEVLAGVGEGDRVVTQGALLLDGQAQLNGLTGPMNPAAASTTQLSRPAVPLTAAQLQALRSFLDLADAARESLSADSFARFNELAPKVHAAAGELATVFEGSPGWQTLIRKVVGASHLDPAPDLPAARKEFLPFSTAVVDFAKSLRGLHEFPELKIYQCPMSQKAFPGAPPRASWLQLKGPIRNPYFGSEMLDCGTEVPP